MKTSNTLKKLYTVVSIIVLIALAFCFVFPLYWIVTGAFKTPVSINSPVPDWIPKELVLDNFKKLFSKQSAPIFELGFIKGPMAPAAVRWMINTVFMAVMAMVLTCLTASMAGYALAKKRFHGRIILFTLIVCAMALPKQVILIPLLKFITELGWIDTYKALVLPAVGWPFGVFLMKQFSHSVPNELLESARIDGCNELKTFISIVLPIIKPGIGALAIFTFIASWNDYFSQLIFTNSEMMKTLPLGVAAMAQSAEFSLNYGLLMAGALLASLPMIIVFLMFQNYFTQGVTMGAVKG